jgi:hypothetical protein
MRLALISLVSLSACATAPVVPPKPAVQVVYQTVNVPVAVPCVEKSKIPPEPEKVAGKLTGDAKRDLDTVAASATRLRAWGQVLSSILIGCTAP